MRSPDLTVLPQDPCKKGHSSIDVWILRDAKSTQWQYNFVYLMIYQPQTSFNAIPITLGDLMAKTILIWVISIIASVIIGTILDGTLANTMLPTPEIEITSPNTSDSVTISPTIKGTYSGPWGEFYSGAGSWIKDDYGPFMWVFVNPVESQGRWWPQGDRAIDPLDGSWSTKVNLGGENSTGTEFVVAAIFVNKEEDKYLRDYADITKRCEKYPDIELPHVRLNGDSIKVTRI